MQKAVRRSSELEKIKWVEIENFRSFSELKIESLGDVSIIVGRNNTGKSTFLEALFLSLKEEISILRSVLEVLFEKRGIGLKATFLPEPFLRDLRALLNKFFWFSSNNESALIRTSISQVKMALIEEIKTLKELVDELSLKDRDTFLKETTLYESAIVQERIIIEGAGEIAFVKYTAKEREKGLLSRLFSQLPVFDNMMIPLTYNKEEKNRNLKILIDSSLFCNKDMFGSIFVSLVKNLENHLSPGIYEKLKHLLSDFFSEKVEKIYPLFSDLFIELETKKIPFSLVGDGIKNFTLNLLSLNLDKPTYVFLEEPETFLHPKMMDVLSKEIVHSGKRNQIFLTTHSLEFVENLLYYAKKRTDVDVKVIGFYDLVDGKLDYEIYSEEQAYTIVNKLGADLR